MDSLKLMGWLLNWTLAIGIAGGLVDLVADMRHKAWHADHVGIISMRSLTRQLMYPDTTVLEMKGLRRGHRSR